jgi:2'-5' RNA ligase
MPPLRLFIAVELTPDLRQAILGLQEDLKRQLAPRAVRWTNPEGIHLTLKFLGDTAPDRVAEVSRGLAAAAAGFPPFHLQVAGMGCFPNPRRPRVLWVGVPEVPQALAGLQRATELQMHRLGFPREDRPFRPHLTLGRVSDRISTAEREQLSRLLAQTQVGTLGTVPVAEVTLFQSDLKPTGAVYTVLFHATLSGPCAGSYVYHME